MILKRRGQCRLQRSNVLGNGGQRPGVSQRLVSHGGFHRVRLPKVVCAQTGDDPVSFGIDSAPASTPAQRRRDRRGP